MKVPSRVGGDLRQVGHAQHLAVARHLGQTSADHVGRLAAHAGVDPRTGEPMTIEANRHVRFRAGKRLREILNPDNP